jgi:Cu-processing system permease protein
MSKQGNKKIFKYVVKDLVRGKLFLGYTFLLLLVSGGVTYIGSDDSKAVVSLLNVVLLVVPLVSIIFGTIYFYNSLEFMELLLTQPVKRSSIFSAEYLGLSSVLSLSFLIGIGLPGLISGFSITFAFLIAAGVMLTFIFVGIAYFISVVDNDKTRAVAFSIIIWLFLSLIYDGVILILSFVFMDYPIENIVLVLSALNPIDLSRIMIILNLDLSALMGFTGASFEKYLGSGTGVLIAFFLLILWIVIPYYFTLRKFRKRNF